MNRLPAVQATAQQALNRNADLLYRSTLTFRLGPHEWRLRCSVKDPSRVDRTAIAAAEAASQSFGVAFTAIRLLTHHPDDPRPVKGAQAPWDGGTLEILAWSQASDFTGQKLATCVLRR